MRGLAVSWWPGTQFPLPGRFRFNGVARPIAASPPCSQQPFSTKRAAPSSLPRHRPEQQRRLKHRQNRA